MKLLEGASYLGALRAVELACFERLAKRAPLLEPASCAAWAASAAQAHAWRAGLLEVLLPVSPGLPSPEELTVLPGGALFAELAGALPDLEDRAGPRDGDSPQDTGPALVVGLVGRLYPALLDEYARRRNDCAQAGDGAIGRAIARAFADLELVRSEGAVLCADKGWSSAPL